MISYKLSNIGSDTKVNFQTVKQKYRENPLPILQELVGAGEVQGSDYVALNPRRNDRHRGSFRIKISTGGFYDFATGDKGGSIIDLVAFIYNCEVIEAVAKLKNFWGEGYSYKSMGYVVHSPVSQFSTKNHINPKVIWEKSVVLNHSYLKRKGISIGNARVNLYKGKANLVIPLMDRVPEKYDDQEIKGLQFINEDGQKRFFGSVKGQMHVSSGYERSREVIVISEGYATARSIAESTEFLVLAAMSSINIRNVVEKIAAQFPNSKIIIAADNDEAGRKAVIGARKAISKTDQCRAVYPISKFNDFNDMYQAIGTDGLRKFFSRLDTRK